MNIQVLHLLEGAKAARGLTVIIDVFRAFSLECYLYAFGAREVRPVGAIEEALSFREPTAGRAVSTDAVTLAGREECALPNEAQTGQMLNDVVLIGERGGVKLPGFDYGNSPSQVDPQRVQGRRVIHTTSAGTQGIVNAAGAEEILTGSLVNARAVAAYIRAADPPEVSLVAMGAGGMRPAPEDELCAAYIQALLTGKDGEETAAWMREEIAALRTHGGDHFFLPDRQEDFPEQDFWMCTALDRFDFVLRVERDKKGFLSRFCPAPCSRRI